VRDGGDSSFDLPDKLSGIFSRERLDRILGDLPVGLVCRSEVRELLLRSAQISSQPRLIASYLFFMAGLVPAIHVFLAFPKQGRGCPAQGRA
jgi:hypothetical protein